MTLHCSQPLALRRMVIVGVSLAFICGSVSPSFAVSLFTDRTTWQAAINSVDPTASFMNDGFGNVIAQAQSITFDSGVISTNSTAPDPIFDDNSVMGGVYENTVDTDGNDGSPLIDWTFPMAILGFGADFGTAANTLLDANETVITGNFDGSGDITVTPSNGFFGIIGTSPFSSIRFSNQDAASFDVFTLDDLVFAKPGRSNPPPAVPEPSTIVLLGSGLAGLIGWHYRKKHHK